MKRVKYCKLHQGVTIPGAVASEAIGTVGDILPPNPSYKTYELDMFLLDTGWIELTFFGVNNKRFPHPRKVGIPPSNVAFVEFAASEADAKPEKQPHPFTKVS